MRTGPRNLLRQCAHLIVAPAISFASPLCAQQTDSAKHREPASEDKDAIIITGVRGSAVTDVAPIAELDANAIAATGASTMGELLTAIRGQTQAADGSDPIFLLNAQRVSGYQEIGSLPPEAIDKVEVLPEQSALKFGFPPTRRVVNFITKRRFHQIEVKGSAGTTTNWGSATEKANAGLTRLRNDGRLTVNLEYKHTDALHQSERHVRPDPDIPFDAVGNITDLSGGEIDPALSALAGRTVTIAPVPSAPGDLLGYAAGANQPRLFDLGPYSTLSPDNDSFKAEAVIANRIGKTLAGSLSLSAERNEDRALGGPATARLIIPSTSSFSPFSGPVILNRYLTEADPLRQRETTTTLHAGGTLRGAIAGWQWDATGSLDQKQVDGRAEIGMDVSAANAAIAAGADPFAPLDPSLLAGRLVDKTMQRTRTALAKTVVTGSPFRLPAGKVTLTGTVEADRSTVDSTSRGADLFDLHLGRNRIEGGAAIDLPLTSRKDDVLGFIGDLSVNASANVRRVGGFGTLHDSTYGFSWGPFDGVQLLGTIKRSAAAPDMMQQSTPEVQVANVPMFDFVSGRTELVTVTRVGNPDLLAERRLIRSLTLNVKPFEKSQLRLSVNYEDRTIRNQTGTVYAVNAQTEAILPDFFQRDSNGRLASVTFRPINFYLERQRALQMTLTSSGRIGKEPPAPAEGEKPKPQINYYAGMGPTINFTDRLTILPGTQPFDLLDGDSIGTWTPRAYGYAYGGINYGGFGATFNAWYGASRRVRDPNPESDLRFASMFKLTLGAYLPVHRLLPDVEWTNKLQLRFDAENITDSRQKVRDRNGNVPFRYQTDLIDPIGQTVTVTLRKLM